MGILIDTDPALGLPLADIDDALAIWFCHRAGLGLDGLTTVFGNASGEDTWAVGVRLGDAVGVPVHRGAEGPGDTDTPAVCALLEHTGTVLAIGPLTNIAAALDRGARWERLVVLGGTDRWLPNLRPLHTTELNFALDPDAAERVLPHTDVLFPMEICRTVLFDGSDLAHLPAWLRERCTHWVGLAPLVTLQPGFHPWDLLPAIWLDDPDLFTTVQADVHLRRRRGYRGHCDLDRRADGRTEVALALDVEGFRRRWRAL